MRLAELDEMRKNAIRWEMDREREERAEAFRRLIDEFNEYERRIELEEQRERAEREESDEEWMWLDPKDKKVKRVKKLSWAGGSLANLITNSELRKEFY